MIKQYTVIGAGRIRTSDGEAFFTDGDLSFDNKAHGGSWLKIPRNTAWRLISFYDKTDTYMISMRVPDAATEVGVVLRKLAFEALKDMSELVVSETPDAVLLLATDGEPASEQPSEPQIEENPIAVVGDDEPSATSEPEPVIEAAAETEPDATPTEDVLAEFVEPAATENESSRGRKRRSA